MDIKTRLLVGVLKMAQLPKIPSEPKVGKWYGIPLKGCVSSDGKEVHAGFRKGTENKLVILLLAAVSVGTSLWQRGPIVYMAIPIRSASMPAAMAVWLLTLRRELEFIP